jgi:hypothetical protein
MRSISDPVYNGLVTFIVIALIGHNIHINSDRILDISRQVIKMRDAS